MQVSRIHTCSSIQEDADHCMVTQVSCPMQGCPSKQRGGVYGSALIEEQLHDAVAATNGCMVQRCPSQFVRVFNVGFGLQQEFNERLITGLCREVESGPLV